MPSYRSKISCASRADPFLTRPKKTLTEEEKEDAKMKREINKMLKERRVAWEAALPSPWSEGNSTFRHPVSTRVMFKSDAKKTFGLTEAEVLTLRHESIPRSPKTYFSLADVQALQQRKFDAGALFDVELKGNIRVLLATASTGRRCKANFSQVYDGDARVYEYLHGPNGRIAQTKAAKAKKTAAAT
ncbi:hypothetical protein B0H15DRAFT_1021040 [Mycena belliarum]|uniref:Uncharacterized protein n=1 Tax=Mycena belliarum TaxID=1033014 RepID=A0AAD6U602_9AGAR|nr:hypothetical protein B0H15DRAFT_1021040 [Mycena belliae]